MSETFSGRLNFDVRLYGERMDVKEWERIARRIARAAIGRSRTRNVVVFAGDASVTICENSEAIMVPPRVESLPFRNAL
jgi:hypothetical protein